MGSRNGCGDSRVAVVGVVFSAVTTFVSCASDLRSSHSPRMYSGPVEQSNEISDWEPSVQELRLSHIQSLSHVCMFSPSLVLHVL